MLGSAPIVIPTSLPPTARRLVDRFLMPLAPIWKRDAIFLIALTGLNLFLARRTFSEGIWADNDSVSHYAFLRYFVEEFHPKTGTFLGWCPKFNLGLPYLLFNVPPLLYVVTGTTALATGLAPLLSLKLWMVAAFLAVPLLTFALARTFEQPTGDLPKFVALATSLFSSELFGLEFFFKNGMLNPAFAVPFLLAALVCYRRSITTPHPRALAWIAATGACFALTMLTHTLSAYMLCVALFGFAFGTAPRSWGRNVVTMGAVIALGVLLDAFWLVPSMPFAAKADAAYTWIRDPGRTLGYFADGSLLASYPVGFFPSFFTQSNAAIVANACAVYGAWRAVRLRSYAFLGCAVTLVLALWIAVGPRYPWLIDIAPMYDRLLWYRFITLAAAMTMVLAGYGAWQLVRRDVFGGPLNWGLLAAGAIWALYVMTGRAVRVKTASSQPEFQESFDSVAAWLNEHGDKRGRIYSEFLGSHVVQAISVNYPREMLPIVTGFEEVSGWVYENNPASQVLQKKGPYWYDPLPMIELAPRYDVKYIVAGTPAFTKALSEDPRWSRVLETRDLVLFEAKRAPSRVEAPDWDARVESQDYVEGGGYRYAIALQRRGAGASAPSELLMKTNGSPGWRATSGGRTLVTGATPDGLLSVQLPADLPDGAHVDLEWGIAELRRKGNLVSLVGVALALALLAASRARIERFRLSPRLVQGVGLGALALGLVGLAVRARKLDLSHVAFGLAEGMEPVFDATVLRVGAFDDLERGRPNHLVESAWGPRELCGEVPCRRLRADAGAAAQLKLAPTGANELVIRGEIDAYGEDDGVDLALLDPHDPGGAREQCRVHVRLGVPLSVPRDCAHVDGALEAPGVVRGVRILAPSALRVSAIEVRSGIAWLEAESFRNVVDDGGSDAFYGIGSARAPASNGVSMLAAAGWGEPIDLKKEVSLAPGSYDAWALVYVFPERFATTRADIVLDDNGHEVGTLGPRAHDTFEFWEELGQFQWLHIGEFRAERSNELTMSVRWRQKAEAALADIDAVALVPLALDSH